MKAICDVCMHRCALEPGQYGRCRARKNEDGKIVCANYGKITSIALDPIEKKPLRRFYPGSQILSVGSFGCNLRCPFCQNHDISMAGEGKAAYETAAPEELAAAAARMKNRGNIGIAFTYNEPLVGYEFVRDTARLVKEAGMKTVLVTNGSVNQDILEEILPWIDAMNIDLKGFTEDYYGWLGGDLDTVKAFIRRSASECHVELTVLIVPGKNDGISEMEEMAGWIAWIDADIPLHITRFFPRWHMTDQEPTNIEKMYELADAARKKLHDVGLGNV